MLHAKRAVRLGRSFRSIVLSVIASPLGIVATAACLGRERRRWVARRHGSGGGRERDGCGRRARGGGGSDATTDGNPLGSSDAIGAGPGGVRRNPARRNRREHPGRVRQIRAAPVQASPPPPSAKAASSTSRAAFRSATGPTGSTPRSSSTAKRGPRLLRRRGNVARRLDRDRMSELQRHHRPASARPSPAAPPQAHATRRLLGVDGAPGSGVGSRLPRYSGTLARRVRRATPPLSRRDTVRARRTAPCAGGEEARPSLRRSDLAPTCPARPSPSLVALLEDNAVEGCVKETFGALLATWQAEHAANPRIRRTLRRIAADETRHAALAWGILAWGMKELAPTERRRVEASRARGSGARNGRHSGSEGILRCVAWPGTPSRGRSGVLLPRSPASWRRSSSSKSGATAANIKAALDFGRES